MAKDSPLPPAKPRNIPRGTGLDSPGPSGWQAGTPDPRRPGPSPESPSHLNPRVLPTVWPAALSCPGRHSQGERALPPQAQPLHAPRQAVGRPSLLPRSAAAQPRVQRPRLRGAKTLAPHRAAEPHPDGPVQAGFGFLTRKRLWAQEMPVSSHDSV